jgi:hypothetical protein
MRTVYELVSVEDHEKWGTYSSPVMAESARERLVFKLSCHDSVDDVRNAFIHNFLIVEVQLDKDLF